MVTTQEEEGVGTREEQYGRDELNICEFPITLLTDRPPDGIRTVKYKDRIHDRAFGHMIDRTVTVTGSDEFGLTTATDADVLIALIQHTRLTNNFTSPKVPFSRYELIKILRWNKEGHNYKRLAQSLRRWAGITVCFDQSWRDKARRKWSSHTMHILNDVIFNFTAGRRPTDLPDDGTCWYYWGDKMFESLQVGNLKRLDLDMYFGLNSAIAKFMYRYLDKHFYKHSHLRFDLLTFAHEKLGMSRTYKIAQVKNKLQASIQELVGAGFIEAEDDRYERTEEGQWFINFNRRSYTPIEETPPEEVLTMAASRLIDYGVSQRVAKDLAAKYPEEEIDKQIQAMLWKKRKNPSAVQDQAAYLVSAIDQGWQVPDGYVEEVKVEEKKAIRQVADDEERKKKLAQKAEQDRVHDYWAAMDPSAQEEFMKEAIEALPDDQKENLNSHRVDSPVHKLLRQGARLRLIRIKLGLNPDS